MVIGIFEAKLVAFDRIDVRLTDGNAASEVVGVSLRDFLDFGHFLVALRMAMNEGRLREDRIDRGRLRESWEPRRELLERKLCEKPREGY